MTNEQTRRKLLEIAREKFLSEGYGAVSVQKIAKAAGISKKTVYKYAASKADLFMEIVKEALLLLQGHPLMVTSGSREPEVALREFLRSIAALALSEDGLRFFRMIVREATSFPEMMSAFHEVTTDLSRSIVAWMEHQRQQGWIEASSAQDAARAIMTLLLSETRIAFLLGLRSAPCVDEQEQLVDKALRLFLHGVRPLPRQGK